MAVRTTRRASCRKKLRERCGLRAAAGTFDRFALMQGYRIGVLRCDVVVAGFGRTPGAADWPVGSPRAKGGAVSTTHRRGRMQYVDRRSVRSPGEREFFVAMALVLLAALLFGFARTFFLKPWFPEAQALTAAETYFLCQGIAFATWFVLLIVQSTLIVAGNVRLHRRLGKLGIGLGAIIVLLGGRRSDCRGASWRVSSACPCRPWSSSWFRGPRSACSRCSSYWRSPTVPIRRVIGATCCWRASA